MIAPYSIDWLGDTLVATGLIIVAVLLLRRPVARFFGPQIAYLLWGVPALRLVMPAFPGAPSEPTIAAVAARGANASAAFDPIGAIALPDAATVAPSLLDGLASVLPLIWLGGASLCLASILLGHLVFRHRILAQSVEILNFEECRVVRSPMADGPFAIGLLDRLIVVPDDFELQFTDDQRLHVLRHEAAHHRHGDLWANFAAAVVVSAQWFNPLAWWAWKIFRLDQERACDARIIAGASRDERAAYAATLARAAIGPRRRQLALVAPVIVQTDLKERLKMLQKIHAVSGPRRLIGLVSVGAFVIAGLAVSATIVPATAAAPDLVPVPPAPPAVPATPEAPLPPVPLAAPDALVPPVPPIPPLPSDEAPQAGSGEHRTVLIRKRDGRTVERRIIAHDFAGEIPTEAEIRAMIPEIDVEETAGKCADADPVSTETIQDGERRRIRIKMCNPGEIAKNARADALAGLREARGEIARENDMGDAIRAKVLADLDREIARLQSAGD